MRLSDIFASLVLQFSLALASFERFEKVTDQLPENLKFPFDCSSRKSEVKNIFIFIYRYTSEFLNLLKSRIIGGETANQTWPFIVQFRAWKKFYILHRFSIISSTPTLADGSCEDHRP